MPQWNFFSGRGSGDKEVVADPRAVEEAPRRPAEAAQMQPPPVSAAPPAALEAAPHSAEPPGALPSINDYHMRQTLGVGAFGKVKLAEHKETGELFAIKCIQKSRMAAARQFERLQREIRILKMLRHPNVIQLHAVIETESDIYLVMENVAGGDLLDFINSRGAMPEEQARDLVGQVMCGLQFCHSLGVAHRDLKPENILINESGMVKITDFGLSNMQNAGEHLSTLCGSPFYAAPELLDGSTTKYDGTEADIWSVGVIAFAILCGELPFDGQSLPDLFAKITAAQYTIPAQLALSAECKDILSRMLVRAPNGRSRMSELRSHPWFTGLKQDPGVRARSGSGSGSGEAVTIMDLNRSTLDSTWRTRNLGTGTAPAESSKSVPRSLSHDAPMRALVDDPAAAQPPEQQ